MRARMAGPTGARDLADAEARLEAHQELHMQIDAHNTQIQVPTIGLMYLLCLSARNSIASLRPDCQHHVAAGEALAAAQPDRAAAVAQLLAKAGTHALPLTFMQQRHRHAFFFDLFCLLLINSLISHHFPLRVTPDCRQAG